MSFNGNNHQSMSIDSLFGVIPIILIIIIGLGVKLYMGKKLNNSLTDQDIAAYTSSLGIENDCYFENVKIQRDSAGKFERLIVSDKDYKIEYSPVFDQSTKKILGYKVSRNQIMYCTKGGFNYISPIITLDRVLSELPESEIKEKTSLFRRELSNKYIERIGNYLTK